MRTLKLTYNLRINSESNISLSTEEILETDDQARVRGHEAMLVIKEFINGLGEEMDDE